MMFSKENRGFKTPPNVPHEDLNYVRYNAREDLHNEYL